MNGAELLRGHYKGDGVQARVIMVGSERWLDLGSIRKVKATGFPSGWDRSRGKDSKNDHKV